MTIIGVSHPDDRRSRADSILDTHRPRGPALNWSWRAIPTANNHRPCLSCGNRWPCDEVTWARDVKTHDRADWSL